MASEVAWTNDNAGSTQPVAGLSPNGYGLYDMSGNVFEWCWDWHSTDYYSSSPSFNPLGPDGPLVDHVERGGAYTYGTEHARVSDRNRRDTPGTRINFTGLRIARNAPGSGDTCELSVNLQVNSSTVVTHTFDAEALPSTLYAAFGAGGGGEGAESVDDFYLASGSGVTYTERFYGPTNWCQASGYTEWFSSGHGSLAGTLAHRSASVPVDSDISVGVKTSFMHNHHDLRLMATPPGGSCTVNGDVFLLATVNPASADGACVYYNQLSSGAYSDVACSGSLDRPGGHTKPIDLDVSFSPECDL